MVLALACAERAGDPYAAAARANLDLLRRERAGAAVVNRGGTFAGVLSLKPPLSRSE